LVTGLEAVPRPAPAPVKVGPYGLVAVFGDFIVTLVPLNRIVCPADARAARVGLSARSCATVVPLALAIWERVSPDLAVTFFTAMSTFLDFLCSKLVYLSSDPRQGVVYPALRATKGPLVSPAPGVSTNMIPAVDAGSPPATYVVAAV
jgi:hypothetical protein